MQSVCCYIIGMPNLSLTCKKDKGKDIDRNEKKGMCSWCENTNNGHEDACERKGGLKS